MSEARKRVLKLLQEGKITLEESEELLAAIEKGSGPARSQDSVEPDSGTTRTVEPEVEPTDGESGSFKGRAGNFASEFAQFAQTAGRGLRDTVKKMEPPTAEFKARMKEFGGWMQNFLGKMVSEFSHMGGEPVDGISVDFTVPEPDGFNLCRSCQIENLFGSVTVTAGETFALKVHGRISRAALAGQPPNLWFISNAVQVQGDRLNIGLDRKTPSKAVLELELTLPVRFKVAARSVSAPLTVKGAFPVESLESVSGDIRLWEASLTDGRLETVSGNIHLEGGSHNFEVKTTSGDLLVKSCRISRLRLESVSGDLLVTGVEVDENTRLEAVSTSGDLTIEAVRGPWSRAEATTRTGDVAVKWEGQAVNSSRSGAIIESGKPGAVFTCETVSGDIRFS